MILRDPHGERRSELRFNLESRDSLDELTAVQATVNVVVRKWTSLAVSEGPILQAHLQLRVAICPRTDRFLVMALPFVCNMRVEILP